MLLGKRTKASFLRWWMIVCLQLLAIAIAVTLGFHIELWNSDQTKLSFVIAGLWAVTTATIGVWHIKIRKQAIDYLTKIGWFISEVCIGLGMMGTVIGLFLMLNTTFAGIDVENTNTLQQALSDMALGMSTALLTTLVGLIASQFIKVQLVNLEHLIDINEENDDTERQRTLQ